MFEIKGKCKVPKVRRASAHLTSERKERLQKYLALPQGELMDCLLVDKNHPNGWERHEVRSSRIVYIYNDRTELWVTCLYARDEQLIRYGMNPRDFDTFIQGYNNIDK